MSTSRPYLARNSQPIQAIVSEWGPTPVQEFARKRFFWFDLEAWVLLLQSLVWLVSAVMAVTAAIYAVVVVIKWRNHAARE